MNSAICCFVPGCPNSEGNTTNATFYEFPEELQEEWLNAIGRNRDTFIVNELICSEHFESTDFDNDDPILTLNRTAIPSLNLPAQEIEPKKQKFNSSEEFINTILQPNIDTLFECESGDEYSIHYEDVLNCRTCLEEIGLNEGHAITETHREDQTLKDMIVYCVPQTASTLLDTDIICDKCVENVKICASFIENCLKVENELIESHDDYVNSGNENDRQGNDTSQIYNHVSLDHNYVPETIEKTDKTIEATNETSTFGYDCTECDRSFKTKNYLLNHVRKMHGKPERCKKKCTTFACDLCDTTFMTKLGYDLHRQLSHRDTAERKKHPCKECGTRFSTLPDLATHKEQRHGFTCTVCFSTFATKQELNVHGDVHPASHLCEVCGKGFKKAAGLKEHAARHNDSHTHLCDKCGKGFKSNASLNLHLKYHDPELKFKCDKCSASFQKKYRLKLHENVVHLGVKEYKCAVCDKKFCYETNLKSHYKLKHSGIKPYQCERCGLSFARADYLRRHTSCESKTKRRGFASWKRKYRYKRDSTPVTCKLCDKIFKDVQMLRLHIKTHTTLRKYKCRTCNLTFTTSGNRDRHEKVHEDCSFRCEVCFKRLETQEALDEHCLMSHENSKKYKCHVCNELFARKYLLHSHLAEKHGDVKDFEKEKEVLYKVVMQDYLLDN